MSYAATSYAYDAGYDDVDDRPRTAPRAPRHFPALSLSLAIAVVVTGASGAFIFDRIEHLPGIEAQVQPGQYSEPLAQDSEPAPELAAMTPMPAPIPMTLPATDTSNGETLQADLGSQDAQQVTDAVDTDASADAPTVDTTPVLPVLDKTVQDDSGQNDSAQNDASHDTTTQDETPAPSATPATDNSPVSTSGVN